MESPPSYRDQLIEGHRSYVYALATKIRNKLTYPVNLDELIAYGNLGLVEAAEHFDPRKRVAFTTYSYYRIRGAIFDGLRESGYFPHSSNATARFATHADELAKNATDEQGGGAGAPTVNDDIASTEALIERLIPIYLLSLDSEQVPDVIDGKAFSAEEMERLDMISFVRMAMRELTAEDRELLEAIYFKYISMTDLAAQRGVNKSWISRLHERAIGRLRDVLRRQGLLVPPS